jgi:predicted esterase
MEEILKKEVVYKIGNSMNVNVQKDLVYKSNGSNNLLMDIYHTAGFDNQKLPAVILIHGEAKDIFNFKDIGQYTSLGKLIAVSGINAITFNHRVLSDGFSVAEVINDINCLIRFLIDNAESLNIDKNRIAVWCFSGGVPFGLYTALHEYSKYVKCIIDITDLEV